MWKLLEAIRIQYKFYYVRLQLRRFCPEVQEKLIARGKDPKPLPPLPEKSREPVAHSQGTRGAHQKD